MLSALSRRSVRVFVVALAIARGDGRPGSSARAAGAAAEVGWFRFALYDSAPGQSGLSGLGIEVVQQFDSSRAEARKLDR